MPQMSPMWWTSLMIVFIMTFLMLNSMFYFKKEYKLMKEKSYKKNIQKNWKW